MGQGHRSKVKVTRSQIVYWGVPFASESLVYGPAREETQEYNVGCFQSVCGFIYNSFQVARPITSSNLINTAVYSVPQVYVAGIVEVTGFPPPIPQHMKQYSSSLDRLAKGQCFLPSIRAQSLCMASGWRLGSQVGVSEKLLSGQWKKWEA